MQQGWENTQNTQGAQGVQSAQGTRLAQGTQPVQSAQVDAKKQKLMKAVLEDNARILAENQVELTDAERERFYRMTATGAIKPRNFERIITGIKGPEIEAIFAEIRQSKFKMRILAYMTGVGFDNFEQASKDTVATFLEKYQNPSDFTAAKNDFLEIVRRSNPAAKYREYAREMDEFVKAMYGKKQEYTELAAELVDEAEKWQIDQEAIRLEAEFLPRAEIEGDAWRQGGREYVLTPEMLKQAGLGPRFLLEIGGVEIAVSKVFRADVHEAAIAYVKFDSGVKVRGYYRSNSQGMWRYLADYVGTDGQIEWYGVGFNEESLTLPLKIQKTLNMAAMKEIYEMPGANMAFFLGGTAKRYNTKEEYKQRVAENQMVGDYYTEVSRAPKLDFGTLAPTKHPPESIDVSGGPAPDFRNQLDHYQMETEMYGTVMVRQFPSLNDELRYLICEVGEGEDKRVWIGGIEVNAPISSTGLKTEWVSTGDICTPLYEYRTMTGGYGVPITDSDKFNHKVDRIEGYEDMWEKYLRLVPIIRKYLFTWRG